MHFHSHINFCRLILPFFSLIFVQSLFIPPPSSRPTTVNQKMHREFWKHGKMRDDREMTSSYVRSNYFRRTSQEIIYLANGPLKFGEKMCKTKSRACLIRNVLPMYPVFLSTCGGISVHSFCIHSWFRFHADHCSATASS